MKIVKFLYQRVILLLICFFKISVCQAPFFKPYWLVWNVGQGQWVTEVQYDQCTHYDFGGEVFALRSLRPLFKQICQNKLNQLVLSHGDLDHYAFYNFIVANARQTCWLIPPPDELRRIQIEAPLCSDQAALKWSYLPKSETTKNESSQIIVQNGFLLPGDSPKKMEQSWIQNAPKESIQILILGHHGSRTSTSHALLKALPYLKMTVASARFKKYGHPHKDTIQILQKFRMPLLRTEDWGTVQIESLN